MSEPVNPKFFPYTLILAGCLFFSAGAIGLFARQFALISFLGVGAIFIAIGASKLNKLRHNKD